MENSFGGLDGDRWRASGDIGVVDVVGVILVELEFNILVVGKNIIIGGCLVIPVV